VAAQACKCETKTKDNVFVMITCTLMYNVDEARAYDAYYKLTDTRRQIESYVFDTIRSTVPKMELDQLFAAKVEIAHAIEHHLTETMTEFGYHIVRALVTDIDPDARVKASMNEINAAKRMKEAQLEKAMAEKISLIAIAQADSESKYLSGVGVARQRAALVAGLETSITDFEAKLAGTSPKDIMDLLLLTQYFDMLKDVGSNKGASKTLFLPHGPSSVNELQRKMAGMMSNMADLKVAPMVRE